MKDVLLLCLLAVGSQGNVLGDFGTSFSGLGKVLKDTFHPVIEQGKQVGQQLLEQAKQQGGQLASQALQNLLFLFQLHYFLTTLCTATKLSAKLSHSNILTKIVPAEKEAKKLLENRFHQMHDLLNAAISKLEETAHGFHEQPVNEIFSKVDEIVGSHKSLQNHLKDDLVNGLTDIMGKVLSRLPTRDHKRSGLTDTISSIGKGLAAFFKPHIDALNEVVSGVGDSLKNTTGTFAAGVDPAHSDTQATQSSSQAIVQHGKNALEALKDSRTDILHQALTNMQPHLHNIINHGSASRHQGINALGTNQTTGTEQ
ncbi:hypothetical protein FSP39_023664 [Pinctada imbricata]|uniref:Uncharacterized protein n=1 Tax=Pinctada imbricata TaxID=66713 RepID=A0AA88YG52_PINIB|nr:hypothetical protein FSP39_023664 [Pinctada imbricata]